MVRFSATLLILAVSGCTMQWRIAGLPPTVPPKTVVEIWSHDTAVHWRAVVASPDSIRGIPNPEPIECSSCRRALARSDIDSFRLRRISDG